MAGASGMSCAAELGGGPSERGMGVGMAASKHLDSHSHSSTLFERVSLQRPSVRETGGWRHNVPDILEVLGFLQGAVDELGNVMHRLGPDGGVQLQAALEAAHCG